VVEDLERTIEEKVTPLVEEAMQKYLGVHIAEIKADISDRLKKSPLLELPVDVSLPFREAKRRFIKAYVERLLRLHFGNVSEVARLSGLDRRSIHRLIVEHKMRIEPIRHELHRPSYVKQRAVQGIIESTLDVYRPAINAVRMESLYRYVPELSKEIVRELPERPVSLAVAEREFERRYFGQLLASQKGSLQQLAKRVGLRYETVYRKLKMLGLK
jgi:DNA-binding NtrC family response regulator